MLTTKMQTTVYKDELKHFTQIILSQLTRKEIWIREEDDRIIFEFQPEPGIQAICDSIALSSACTPSEAEATQ